LILITHIESTFYQNDQHQVHWGCSGSGALKPKGEGVSLMVSDFLTTEWGHLHHGDSEVQIIFCPGKNRDRQFTADHLLNQVDKAINIFQGFTNGCTQALFLFNNAPSHQKCAVMPTYVLSPKQRLNSHNSGPHMHCGVLPTSQPQSFYFPDDHPSMPSWFKGMEQILCEHM
ncbi:hypothetical protein EI94DRAFT_1500911, partial [Lactarius quietus]